MYFLNYTMISIFFLSIFYFLYYLFNSVCILTEKSWNKRFMLSCRTCIFLHIFLQDGSNRNSFPTNFPSMLVLVFKLRDEKWRKIFHSERQMCEVFLLQIHIPSRIYTKILLWSTFIKISLKNYIFPYLKFD